MVVLLWLSVIFLIPILLIFIYIKYRQCYWKNLKVPYIEPEFPLGNFNGLGKLYHTYELFTKYYNEMKGKAPFGGIYFLTKPFVICLDLDFIKNVLIKDFDYFMNRDIYYNERDDPLSANLLTFEEQRWKNMRKKLTSTFTAAKMKLMFPTIHGIAYELVSVLIEETAHNPEVEFKEIFTRYTTDIIGKCAFGIDCNSLKDPNAPFRSMGKEMISAPNLSLLQRFLARTWPNFARLIHVKLLNPNVTKRFAAVIKDIVEYREANNVNRNDFIDLLISLKNSDPQKSLNINNMAAEAFVLFLGAFETSSTLMCFCLYELGQHTTIQEKLRNEVKETLEKYNGELTYEGLAELTYMDQVLNESLRKYPPNDITSRRCNLDYLVPGTNITLKRGQSIIIPVYPIHHDPEYYPNPTKFDPERFTPEECGKRHSMAFLPFGEGPRNCIGLRLGLNQTKIGLANILLNFRIELSEKMQIPITISKKNQVLTMNGGLWLKMIRISKDT